MCSHVCVCTNVCVYMFMVVFLGVHAVHVCARRDVMLFRVRMCVCASMLMHAYFARAYVYICVFVCIFMHECMFVHVCACMRASILMHVCMSMCACFV